MTTANPSCTLEILVHLEPTAREGWPSSDDDRPLNDLGMRQAEKLAEELGKVDAVFSSSAVRCRQSVEPLAKKLGLPVVVLPEFQIAAGYAAPAGWGRADSSGPDPLGGAVSAGFAQASLNRVLEQLPSGGRAVICSYGDIIPVLLALLSGAYDVEMPKRVNGRGSIYTVVLGDDKATMQSRGPAAGFPT